MARPRCAPLVAPFAAEVLDQELPALGAERREEVVAFACRRIDGLPSVMHLGVLLIASVMRLVMALPVGPQVVATLRRAPLPIVGEYVRLVRSLAYAYVWERWPDTGPDGRLGAPTPGGAAA